MFVRLRFFFSLLAVAFLKRNIFLGGQEEVGCCHKAGLDSMSCILWDWCKAADNNHGS